MVVDVNGMSHKPKGLPAKVAGNYDGKPDATGDFDLIPPDMDTLNRLDASLAHRDGLDRLRDVIGDIFDDLHDPNLFVTDNPTDGRLLIGDRSTGRLMLIDATVERQDPHRYTESIARWRTGDTDPERMTLTVTDLGVDRPEHIRAAIMKAYDGRWRKDGLKTIEFRHLPVDPDDYDDTSNDRDPNPVITGLANRLRYADERAIVDDDPDTERDFDESFRRLWPEDLRDRMESEHYREYRREFAYDRLTSVYGRRFAYVDGWGDPNSPGDWDMILEEYGKRFDRMVDDRVKTRG